MKEKEKTGYETNFVCRTDDAVALRLCPACDPHNGACHHNAAYHRHPDHGTTHNDPTDYRSADHSSAYPRAGYGVHSGFFAARHGAGGQLHVCLGRRLE